MTKKQITASEMGSRGGRVRAARYGKRTLSEWAKQGGRPAKLDHEALAKLQELLAKGKSQSECAEVLDVSSRTIGRIVARMKESDDALAS